jgi:hypothetical protein
MEGERERRVEVERPGRMEGRVEPEGVLGDGVAPAAARQERLERGATVERRCDVARPQIVDRDRERPTARYAPRPPRLPRLEHRAVPRVTHDRAAERGERIGRDAGEQSDREHGETRSSAEKRAIHGIKGGMNGQHPRGRRSDRLSTRLPPRLPSRRLPA